MRISLKPAEQPNPIAHKDNNISISPSSNHYLLLQLSKKKNVVARLPLKAAEQRTPVTHKYACPHVMKEMYLKNLT